MAFECILDRTLVCPHYCGCITAGLLLLFYFIIYYLLLCISHTSLFCITSGLRTALLDLFTCQCMSSEMKLQVHLIQGSRLATVITEHVKKCTNINEVMTIKYKCTHSVCKVGRF